MKSTGSYVNAFERDFSHFAQRLTLDAGGCAEVDAHNSAQRVLLINQLLE
jgi:hypothetical protein